MLEFNNGCVQGLSRLNGYAHAEKSVSNLFRQHLAPVGAISKLVQLILQRQEPQPFLAQIRNAAMADIWDKGFLQTFAMYMTADSPSCIIKSHLMTPAWPASKTLLGSPSFLTHSASIGFHRFVHLPSFATYPHLLHVCQMQHM